MSLTRLQLSALFVSGATLGSVAASSVRGAAIFGVASGCVGSFIGIGAIGIGVLGLITPFTYDSPYTWNPQGLARQFSNFIRDGSIVTAVSCVGLAIIFGTQVIQ